MKNGILILSIVSVFYLIGCERRSEIMDKNNLSGLNNVSTASLNSLAQKKIFFGHQSVGNNIIEGMKCIITGIPEVKLNIVETNNPADFDGPIFGHAKVGKNLDPFLKIDDFKKIMESGIGSKVDIAFLKFCYLDITEKTDIDMLFDYYIKTFNYLRNKYPNTQFIHLTVPLTLSQSTKGIKAKIKRLFKKRFWDEDDNIKRNLFNQKIITYFIKEKTVFDLAKYEATFPDGIVNIFDKLGIEYFSLVPAYTDDGSHLNNYGRKTIADRLLKLLSTLPKG